VKSKEEKLIALKVLLNVQDIEELSSSSKAFKSEGVIVVPEEQKKKKGFHTVIQTPYVKEVSWLLFQFQYVFKNSDEEFALLCESLSRKLVKTMQPKEIAEFLITKSGALLS
jgi:hypothetical protein